MALGVSWVLLKRVAGGIRQSLVLKEKKGNPYPLVHFGLWALLVLLSVWLLYSGHLIVGLAVCGIAQFFPLKVTKGKVFV